VSESVGHLGAQLLESGREYATEAGESIAHSSSDLGSRLSDRARDLWNGRRRWRRQEHEHPRLPVAPAAAGGIGLLALGIGIGWLFDPQRGKARRHWLRDQAFAVVRDAAELGRKTGKHIGNRIFGTYAGARGALSEGTIADRRLEARVRSKLGHAVNDLSDLSIIADRGHVTLIGSLSAEQIPVAVTAVRHVRGVNVVEDRIRPRTADVPSGS
jgi:hypothetical protein